LILALWPGAAPEADGLADPKIGALEVVTARLGYAAYIGFVSS
jgi:hypothetical protein